MPLINFGSIFNFAETLETDAEAVYNKLAALDACSSIREMLEEFVRDCRKNVQTIQRTRRENVTEMILEPIKDFTRAPYQIVIEDSQTDTADTASALLVARKLAQNAEGYYMEAAQKIKALPEVSRALKTIGKKHTAHLRKLDAV
jgi:rubrerythrin